MQSDLLREMVRLAESRRSEGLGMIERINKYNLAMIAFDGTFLSILITNDLSSTIIRVSGAFLIASIFTSLIAVQPKRLKAGALDIVDDVTVLREGKSLDINAYLLDVAELTNNAAEDLHLTAAEKKKSTIISAVLLALSLLSTYILYGYA